MVEMSMALITFMVEAFFVVCAYLMIINQQISRYVHYNNDYLKREKRTHMCDCSLFRFDKHAVSVMQCMYTGSLASADSTCVVSTNAEFQKNSSCRFCVLK